MDFLKRKPNNTFLSTQSPIDKSVKNPVDIPIEQSVEKPIKQPVEKTIEQSVENKIKTASDFESNDVKVENNVINNVDNITPIAQNEKKVKINDFLPKKVDQSVEPSITDKKIEMKYIKDGRSHRTFVFNLELYIKNKEDLNKIINKMKKSFGTQCAHKETEFGFAYGFSGDLSARIKQYLLESHLVTVENFK